MWTPLSRYPSSKCTPTLLPPTTVLWPSLGPHWQDGPGEGVLEADLEPSGQEMIGSWGFRGLSGKTSTGLSWEHPLASTKLSFYARATGGRGPDSSPLKHWPCLGLHPSPKSKGSTSAIHACNTEPYYKGAAALTDKGNLIVVKKHSEDVRHCLRLLNFNSGYVYWTPGMLPFSVRIQRLVAMVYFLQAHNIFWPDINISWKLLAIKVY